MGQTNYSAAKAGVHGFTKALAFEGAAKGITVNTIAPGYIATEMVAAVPKEVLEKSKTLRADGDPDPERLKKWLEEVNPEDLGKYRM